MTCLLGIFRIILLSQSEITLYHHNCLLRSCAEKKISQLIFVLYISPIKPFFSYIYTYTHIYKDKIPLNSLAEVKCNWYDIHAVLNIHKNAVHSSLILREYKPQHTKKGWPLPLNMTMIYIYICVYVYIHI